MPVDPVVERVRAVVRAFLETDLVRLGIGSDDEYVEVARWSVAPAPPAEVSAREPAALSREPQRLEAIKADLVGIFHFGRPVPAQGELLESDRELAYIEALGIRNPVRSLSGGRLASVCAVDGEPVEYGQVLFEIDRT